MRYRNGKLHFGDSDLLLFLCCGAALDSSDNLYCVGTNRLNFSKDFIVIQAHSSPLSTEEPYHHLNLIWQYDFEGVITPIDYADFDGDPEREIIRRLYTIESEWIELIYEGEKP